MSKILILYTSKYGSSSEYARIISDELKGNDVTLSSLADFKGKIVEYDSIIYIAGIKSYEIYEYKKFARKLKKFCDKKIIVCAVGMMSGSVSYARRLIEMNKIDSRVKFYYLRGAIYLEKLKGFDGTIIKHLVSGLMLREDLTNEEKAFVGACLNGKSWVNRENILPIVEQF